MSEAQYIEFGERIRRIGRTHRKLAKGQVSYMNEDGLVVARPVRKSSGLAVRMLFLYLVMMLCFKAFLLAQLGPEAYGERMTALEQGTTIEQLGSYAMKPDPITVWLATKFGAIE